MPGLGKGLGSLIPDNLKKRAGSAGAAPVLPSSAPIHSPAAVAHEVVVKNSPAELPGERVVQVPVEKIKSNRYQPRQTFSHKEIEELSQSIKQYGILQPLVVSPLANGEFELIAGERRLRASKILDMKTVPAILREAKDQQRLELALIENIQRQELNIIEEAAAYRRLIDEFNLSQDEVALRVGKSRPVVTNALRILQLPEEVRLAVMDSKISASHARAIAALPDAKDQVDFFHRIINEQLNVREVEREAKKMVVTKHLRRVSFDPIVESMVENLRNTLGTKVAIKKKGEEGSILISFYSDEELGNIVRKITEA